MCALALFLDDDVTTLSEGRYCVVKGSFLFLHRISRKNYENSFFTSKSINQSAVVVSPFPRRAIVEYFNYLVRLLPYQVPGTVILPCWHRKITQPHKNFNPFYVLTAIDYFY